MTRHIGVVVNPERTDVADEFIARLSDHGCSVTTTTPDDADALGDAIDELVGQGVDAVAAIGGDGTQRTVAARLAGGAVPLAVVPGGTVNLLARVLGVDDLERAAAAAASTRDRVIDLGHMGDETFLLNSSSGWDAAIIDGVDETTKRFGRLGFVATGMTTWLRTRAAPVEIDLDGTRWFDGRAVTVLVLNVGQRGSASIHVAPDAEIDDGRLDVVVLRRHSILGFLRFATAVLRGDPPPRREAAIGQAEHITVSWARPVSVQCDGDGRESAATIDYTTRPAAVRVMLPVD
jgi:diacylglycerol kinase (ATP)